MYHFNSFSKDENGFVLTDDNGHSKRVMRTESEINILAQKLANEKCQEYEALGDYEDNLEDIQNREFETIHEKIFARLGVKNSTENLLRLSYYFLFNEVPERFD